MSVPLRLSDLDSCAALISQSAGRLRGAQLGSEGLVLFEIDPSDNAPEILGAFAAGSLVGNLRLFAQEQRGLRRLLRTTQRGGGPR